MDNNKVSTTGATTDRISIVGGTCRLKGRLWI